MSSIPATTGATGSTPTTSVSNPAAILGQDGFLQLLVAEMQNQDPLSSSQDPTQSVTQMAQFSSVEQLTNLVQGAQQAQSIALIGHTVAYTDSDGNPWLRRRERGHLQLRRAGHRRERHRRQPQPDHRGVVSHVG